MLPSDQLQAPVLSPARVQEALKGQRRRLAVISANDHDSHLAAGSSNRFYLGTALPLPAIWS